MFAPSALRSLTKGAPGLWLAALFLVARLLASSVSMAAPAQNPAADLVAAYSAFCHTGPADDAPQTPAHDHACLVCPACYVISYFDLPIPAVAALPIFVAGIIGTAAAPPPTTGPPGQPRTAAHPTGPPTASV